MKIAVTGCSGFIGSHLVDALLAGGHTVVGIDILTPDRAAHHRFSWLGYDVVQTPLGLFDRPLGGCDALFHLAGMANVNDAFRDPVGCVELNTLGTARMLQACVRAGVGRLLLASTVWVYGACKRDGRVVDEQEPVYVDNTNHVYTSSKLSAEMTCHDYLKLYGQPFTVLRYGIPYGPRMRAGLVVERFVTAAMKGEPLTILGKGDSSRKFIYVGDLIAGHLAALDPKAANKTYTLDGPENVSALDLAREVKAHFDEPPADSVTEASKTLAELKGEAVPGRVQIVHQPARPGDYLGNRTSIHRAEDELGWTPQVSFADGLAAYIHWRLGEEAVRAARNSG